MQIKRRSRSTNFANFINTFLPVQIKRQKSFRCRSRGWIIQKLRHKSASVCILICSSLVVVVGADERNAGTWKQNVQKLQLCVWCAIANAAWTLLTRRNGTIESERQNNGRPSFLKAFPVDGLLNYTNDINSCARVHSCECIPSQPAATNKGAG